MPKLSELLLCSDIDGTALRRSEGVPPRNIEAVRRFTSLGGRFTFATGRVPYMVREAAEHFAINAPIIAANGAMLCEPGSLRVLEEHKITQGVHEAARELVALFDGRAAVIIDDGDFYCPVSASEKSRQIAYTHPMVHTDPCKIEEAPNSCHKILILAENPEQTAGLREEMEIFSGRFGVVVSGERLVELIPQEVDKGRGLLAVARRLGIRMENTVAIGDNENDFELLQAAAFSAAPADAAPAVRARVNRVLCCCMDGALGMLIDELIERCEAG
ncbi:MAG: HAD-IIB family hydrolase [Provencibacterium sp.]|jgi:Cof subfamily protein (haloacid dehalogenase superfamily)|nr:HAD-IIB family hydrolase [Provencibacterium sp.]